jgi:hypothetical protein
MKCAAYWSFACAGLCAIALVMLAGCGSFDPPAPVLERTTSVITVKVDPNLKTKGIATWAGSLCTITLREYPVCLQHEVRHCFEGNWHEGRETTEDCF